MSQIKNYIYVVECEGENYYVGCSPNPYHLLQSGLMTNLCQWTQLHPPFKLLKIYGEGDENSVVEKFMAVYGVEKVRGGSYTTVQLSHWQRNNITKNQSSVA